MTRYGSDYRFLFVDDHGSHLNTGVTDYCLKLNINVATSAALGEMRLALGVALNLENSYRSTS